MLLNRIPWPLNDGGAICMYNALKGYREAGCEVACLAMNTAKHYVKLGDTGGIFTGVKFIPIGIDNRIKPIKALVNLLSSQSYVIERFDSNTYKNALIELLQQNTFDIIHIDGLPPMQYIDTVRQYSTAKIMYRAHNVEYKIWERAAGADTNLIKSWYIGVQAGRLKTFETEALAQADCVLAISAEDKAFIASIQPKATIKVMPAGMDIDESNPVILPQYVSLFFIGALDWLPNLQGLDWFLKDIWPEIHKTFPDLKFHIAGKKMPSQYYNFEGVNVVAHGEVASAMEFMNKHSVLLSPLVSGSGVRIKIIEAMAAGKVVLSTTVSAEGSGAVDGEHILIADNAAEYKAQIKRLLNEPALLKMLSENARKFALDNFQNKKIIARLLDYYRQLCS